MTSDSAPLDLAALLASLSRHGVAYVVIGGVAAQVHGHRRTTRDLDVIPEPGPANSERLAALLAELDAAPVAMPGAPAPTAEQLVAAPVVPPLRTLQGELHILNDVPGARPFAALRDDALVLDLGGTPVPIVALADLLAMKRASGRPRDLEDVAFLDPGGEERPRP